MKVAIKPKPRGPKHHCPMSGYDLSGTANPKTSGTAAVQAKHPTAATAAGSRLRRDLFGMSGEQSVDKSFGSTRSSEALRISLAEAKPWTPSPSPAGRSGRGGAGCILFWTLGEVSSKNQPAVPRVSKLQTQPAVATTGAAFLTVRPRKHNIRRLNPQA